MIKNIYNLGDAALYCDFGNTVNKETNQNLDNISINLCTHAQKKFKI